MLYMSEAIFIYENRDKKRRNNVRILRGDLYYADLTPVIGCEQGGVRPVLIIQNNMGNLHSPTVIVAAVTSKNSKHNLPTHVPLNPNYSGLKAYSIILLEQIRTIDRSRLKEYIGHLELSLIHI